MDSIDLAPVRPHRSADFTASHLRARLARARALTPRARESLRLLCLEDALTAFGENGVIDLGVQDVPLEEIVGSVGRTSEFDRLFRPLNPRLHGRWQQIARAAARGTELPPVDLVRLGGLYFVRDGHHRVSVARAFGWPTIRARVERIRTVAYAMRHTEARHLCTVASQRQFLQRVPLPDDVTYELWLDDPADWLRLADSAEAWGFRQTMAGREFAGRGEFAAAWWTEEVEPTVRQLREQGFGTGRRDIATYTLADR